MPDTNLLGPPKQAVSKPHSFGVPPKEADSKAPFIGALARLYCSWDSVAQVRVPEDA